MKKFKDIRNISENHTSAYSVGSPGVAHGTNWSFGKKDSETKNNLQQAINHELNKSYMSPKTALINLRAKINAVGLDFDVDPSKEVGIGALNFKLKRATSVFGKDLDTPYDKFIEDDGITAYSLSVTINQDDDGLYILDGKIK